MIFAENISYGVGDKIILDNVNVDIKRGQITVILGPNGAGKSTLLKCLTGTLTPKQGSVFFDNKPLESYSLKALSKRRAVLSQSNPVNFPFTALEIVMMGRNPYISSQSPDDAVIAQEVLQSMDSGRLKDRIFPTLSGGEQQRVQIARVLAQVWQQENACLFLDEPTSSLDLKHQHQILQLARRLVAERNFTVCVIMHDLNLAMHYADQAILMQSGKIYSSGEKAKVLNTENLAALFEISEKYLSSHCGKATTNPQKAA